MKRTLIALAVFTGQSAALTMTQKCKADPRDPDSDFKDCKSFNILSLTQAGDDGYMTARFIDFMEQNAYYAARDTYCNFPERDPPRIAMPELFDFIAGSDTGAIIAASLILPKSDQNVPDW